MLGGSKEFQNEHLNKKWNEVTDLESINYKTGIRFKNLTDACKAFFWIEKHNIPFHELAKAAKYFDPENTRFKALRFEARERTTATIVLTVMLSLITLCLSADYFSKHAFLLVKETKTKFMTDGTTATPWKGSSWRADMETCRSGTTGIPSQYDEEVICSAFDEEEASFIQNTISLQKKFVFGLFIILLILLFQSIRKLVAVHTAKRLYHKTNPSVKPR